jgi:general stress protein 26
MSGSKGDAVREVMAHFQRQNIIHMATVEGDQPRVRPVTLIHLDDELYVITGARGGAETGKVRQIKENPKVEFYMAIQGEGGQGFVRGETVASIVDDPELKEGIYGEIDWASSYFDGPEDTSYILLHMEPKAFKYRKPGEYEITQIDVK